MNMSNFNTELEKIQSSLTSNYSNSNGSLNTNNNSYSNSIGELTTKQQDELISWASDLIAESYRLWFIKQLKRVGKAQFVECATAAKKYDGISRQKVFASMLKTS